MRTAASHGLIGGEVSLWLYVAMRDAGRPADEALRMLEAHRALLHGTNEWPLALIDHALGLSSADRALNAAPAGHRCRTLYHMGQLRRIENDLDAARRLLAEAQAICGDIEGAVARQTLPRMGL